MNEAKLLQKLRDLESLFAGATTPGERLAAGHARERIHARLREMENNSPPTEYRFTLQDTWSKKLFLALLRRYDLKPYRYRGQRRTTVMVRVPKRFVDETLWPHFQRASDVLRQHLDEVASQMIEAALDTKDTDAEEREPTNPCCRLRVHRNERLTRRLISGEAVDRRAKRIEKKRRERNQAKKKARALAARAPSALVRLLRSAAHGDFGPCFVSGGWEDLESPALVTVLATRRLSTGQFVPGVALVDRTCLGIKHGFVYEPRDLRELPQILDELSSVHGEMRPCEPLVVQSVVFHAIDYARSLDFEPHPDFPEALFGPRPATLLDTPWHAPEKPIYVSGPYDNVPGTLMRLIEVVGPDNFEHIDALAQLEDDDDDDLFDADDEVASSDDDVIVHSALERTVTGDGTAVRIYIYRGTRDPGWILEIEDHLGGSTVWDELFETDRAALDAAMLEIEQEGIASFADAETA